MADLSPVDPVVTPRLDLDPRACTEALVRALTRRRFLGGHAPEVPRP